MDERELSRKRSVESHRAASHAGRERGLQATVESLVADQAKRTPERVAVVWNGGDAWTYGELLDMADAIARELLARGVKPGELVGVCVPRRPEMVAAVLGVMRAGAAYVALDPAFPAERLGYMATHSGLHQVLVWREADVPQVLAAGAQLLALDGLDPGNVAPATLPRTHGDDLAYVLYTSGSTGLPKGVRILQRNLVNFLASMRREPGLDEHDVLCAVTTLSFDIAALELYLPLVVGARIVIATEEEQVDPAIFARLLREHAVTVLQTTPTLLRLLLSSDRAHEVDGIRLLIGGEAMPRSLAEAMLPRCRELWNLYGPTETTVWSTIERVSHGDGVVPLGKPIANTSIHVLDDRRQRVPDGDIGEIWIGGAGVADGYFRDPGKTAERFLPDPFAGDGSRMYRTGDLGSLRDGTLYFHGRVDDQIKLRGYRIEPGDIEAAALADPSVHQAVAVVREVSEDDRRLVLYVVADPGPGLIPRLRTAMRERLPAYMRPQHIEILDALPRTPNGKIDRKALPPPSVLADPEPAPHGPTSDPLESSLAALWSELLKVHDIGPEDDFFDLGGDSLLAVRVFERMQAMTGVNLPLATLLTAPTVAAQAAAFRAAGAREPGRDTSAPDGHEAQWAPLVPIQPHGTHPPLYFIHAVGGNVLNYVPVARRLDANRPVYGIQALGLDGTTAPLESVPEMARRYLAEIRRVQPRGPYFLAGGSMGGMIAYEMAQQLVSGGDRVGMLAMLDTYAPLAPGNRPARSLSVRRIASSAWARLLDAVDDYRLRRIRTRGGPLPHNLRGREVKRAHYRALRVYRPDPYTGDIVLFRASKQPGAWSGLQCLGWNEYVSGTIEVIKVPGNHGNLIEQPELPQRLREVLQRAEDTVRR